MNSLLAPLRPLADLIDLASEAARAVGTLSVDAVGLLITRMAGGHYPPLKAVAPAPQG